MTPTSTKPLAVVAGNLKTKVQDALGKLMPETTKAQMHCGLSELGSASQ